MLVVTKNRTRRVAKAVGVDLQAVGPLEFFGELCSLAKGFGPILEGVWAGFREREGSIFSNHQLRCASHIIDSCTIIKSCTYWKTMR